MIISNVFIMKLNGDGGSQTEQYSYNENDTSGE